MSFRLAAYIVSAVLLVSCASTPSTPSVPAEEPSEVVQLRFDWPAGWAVPVEETRVRSIEVFGERTESSAKSRWRMVTDAVEDGLRVRMEDIELLDAGEMDADTVALIRLLHAATEATWSVIGPDGEFVRVGGLDEVETLPERFAAAGRPVPEGAEAVLAAVFEPDEFRTTMVGDWDSFLGAWADSEAELGQVLTWEGRIEVMMWGEPLTMEWLAVGRVPCRDAEEALRCVRLETSTHPHREGTLRMLDEVIEPILQEGVSMTKGSYVVQDVIVVDPDGMVPYRYERRAVAKATIAFGDETAELVHEDLTLRTYHP